MTNPYLAPSASEIPEAPVRASSWPKVIGILSIILGGLGFMNYACSIGGTVMGSMMFDFLGDAMPQVDEASREEFEAIMAGQMLPNLISAIIGFVLSTCLIVVGIGTLNRRAWSRRGLLLWSTAKMFHAVLAGFLAYISMTATFSVMQETDASLEDMQSFMQIFGVIAMVASSLFLMAYPLFLLVWMNRGKIVDEVATWR